MASPRRARRPRLRSLVDYVGTAFLAAMLAVGVHAIDGASVSSARDRFTALAAWHMVILLFLGWWWVERRL